MRDFLHDGAVFDSANINYEKNFESSLLFVKTKINRLRWRLKFNGYLTISDALNSFGFDLDAKEEIIHSLFGWSDADELENFIEFTVNDSDSSNPVIVIKFNGWRSVFEFIY